MKSTVCSQQKRGYTIMELVIVILIIAVMSAVAIPTIGNMMTNSNIKSTEREMMELVRAIVGEPEAGFLGFMAEIGDLPDAIGDLYAIGTNSPYNPFTRSGWNGPYLELQAKDIDGDGTTAANEYDVLYDSWGTPYDYDKAAGTVTSWGPDGQDDAGGDDDIVIDIQ